MNFELPKVDLRDLNIDGKRVGKVSEVDFKLVDKVNQAKSKLEFIEICMSEKHKNGNKPVYRDYMQSSNKEFYFDLAEKYYENSIIRIEHSKIKEV